VLAAAPRAENVRPEPGGEAESTLLPPSGQVQGTDHGGSKGWRGSDTQPQTYVAGWWERATKYIHIYLEYHSVCLLVRIGTPSPISEYASRFFLSPQISVIKLSVRPLVPTPYIYLAPSGLLQLSKVLSVVSAKYFVVLINSVVDPHWFSVRIWIRIQLFTLVQIQIRIQGVKPFRIHADPDPDPGQTLPSLKV
jgi:hypothetical protein